MTKTRTKKISKKNKLFFIVGLCILVLVFLGGNMFLYHTRPYATQTVPVEVTVDNYVGINIDSDKLYFGTIPSGSYGTRIVNLTVTSPSYVLISAQGDVATWVDVPHNAFFQEGIQQITISLYVPEEQQTGNYSGELSFEFYKPFVEKLLQN